MKTILNNFYKKIDFPRNFSLMLLLSSQLFLLNSIKLYKLKFKFLFLHVFGIYITSTIVWYDFNNSKTSRNLDFLLTHLLVPHILFKDQQSNKDIDIIVMFILNMINLKFRKNIRKIDLVNYTIIHLLFHFRIFYLLNNIE